MKKSDLAESTDLYIYSDAASVSEHKEQVELVRSYANSITGFRKVYVIEREENLGGVRNALSAIYEMMERFSRIIFLEDDIVTAPGFLPFMNEALNFYENDQRVLSIVGYCPPIDIPDDLVADTFCMPRYSGWGSGIFSRTLEALKTKIDPQEFEKIEDQELFKKCGPDVLRMVLKEVGGTLDAADVRCMYRQAIDGTMTIYPKKSLVQNIGHDGTGYHCGNTSRFHHDSLWDKENGFKFDSTLFLDERILKANYEFRSFGKPIN
ncbi:hypothetical protein [Aliiglaciecola litoralis]|uniref:hypothetical protein n=1 Tax=Aliiglaciecola litoralis TaxID=582857 RepID=UPI0031CFAC1C